MPTLAPVCRILALALTAAPALAQQASNSCSGAPLIQVNTDYTSSSINASSEIQETCGFGDALDVWYRLTAAAAGEHTFTVASDEIDPTVALFTACGGSLLACNDDGATGTDSIIIFTMTAAQSVRIRIAGNFFNDGAFTLRVAGPTVQPPTGACCRGTTCAATTQAACSGFATGWAGASTVCNVPGNFSTPCCKADFNHVGGITVQDVFDFLAAYFIGDPSADFNGQDGVTVGDIFAFLAVYFGGCG